jgi:hypothetical protein
MTDQLIIRAARWIDVQASEVRSPAAITVARSAFEPRGANPASGGLGCATSPRIPTTTHCSR